MTGPGPGAPDRDVTADAASGRGTGRPILALLAIGLAARLIIAYVLPGSGFHADLDAFRFWANDLASHGPLGFYERDFFHDYTPGYLYVLWLVGLVGGALGGVGDLIKLPPILADAALAWLVHRMIRDLGGSERRALLGALIVLVNPITWFDSVVWGQVDSFGVVFLLLAIRELWAGRTERSAVLAVVAALIKPQLGILVPIVAAVTIGRALFPGRAGAADEGSGVSGSRWERHPAGWVRILTTGVAGLLTAILLSAPFGLSVVAPASSFPFVDSALVRQLLSTAAGYPYLSVNAYNAWALLPVDGASLASTGGWIPDAPTPDGAAFGALLGIPAGAVGAAALLLAVLLVSVVVARRPDRLTILVGVAVLALAFFALPTRVHERYLYPLFALGAVLAAVSWRWRVAYLVASVATFLNMYVVLTTLYPDNPSISDWLGIGPTIRSFGWVALIAIGHTGVFAWAALQLRPGAARTLRREVRGAAAGAAGRRAVGLVPAFAGPAGGVFAARAGADEGVAMATSVPAAGSVPTATHALPAATPAVAAPSVRLLPAWFDRAGWSPSSSLRWLRERMAETPVRPDRSADLAREGRGRLDRLDLWLVVVLVASALCLRTFRLEEPARMHFDEVYHARTATEFLQDWRYGLEHTIYEWTHPHLAKYGMAAGIVAFAGHDVQAASNLGVTVRDATIEPRRAPAAGAARAGDRAWVATGDELVGFDLATRKAVARWAVPGAAAVAFDAETRRLFVGSDDGALLALDEAALDALPAGGGGEVRAAPRPVATLDGPVSRLVAFSGGKSIAALLPGGAIAVVDAETGRETGRTTVEGAAELAAVGEGDAVLASPADVTDAPAVASQLATILGGSADAYRASLEDTTRDSVVIDARLTSGGRDKLQKAIEAGTLAGVSIGNVPLVGVGGSKGLTFLGEGGRAVSSVDVAGGVRGLGLVTGVQDGTQVYATTTDATKGTPTVSVVALTGESAKDGPRTITTIPMPGAGTRVAVDTSAELVEVLGTTPDGMGTTVYVIEPHGNAVFADHRLPFVPAAWAMDTNPQYPETDRGALLAFGASGEAASLDIGHYDFSWRLPGVILGALTVGLLYLLARILFARRSIGVLVGLFVLLDGMFFVQSRIAMNDVYTGVFIVAAYALFARLWLEPERPRWAFWALMPAIGVLLGLALASKWVAAYAIGALAILILARSALGRVLLVVGLVGLTAVLGWMALAVPATGGGSANVTFVIVMIALTLAAAAITVHHPIAWSDEEVRFAIGGPAALGIVVAFGSIALGMASRALTVGPVSVTPLAAGFALVVLGILAWLAFVAAARLGFGPLTRRSGGRAEGLEPPAPAAPGWLRLGSGLGLPAAWTALCLVALPLVVYVVSYLPWAAIEGHQIVPGWPPGHTGQTLLDLTGQMYAYHNNLTAAHAASSPWWAWPLNLKPVWFYQGGFAEGTGASVYDAGNMVVWWLGIPTMLFAAVQAFRRRNLGLALIVVGFLCQWVSWARIDRASFQYHYYTSLPFVVLALGYFVAELWHGASRRTWLFARVAASIALLGPVILWLLRVPLCRLANVEAVNAGSQSCGASGGNYALTLSAAAVAVIVIVAAVVLVRLLADLTRRSAAGRVLSASDLAPLGLTVVLAVVAVMAAPLVPSADPLLTIQQIVPELFAVVVAVPLGVVAVQVLTARDARRFVAGIVAAVAIWFVLLYPNIAALPLPNAFVNAYQLLLPTYPYPFQFAVNTVERGTSISFADPRFGLLLAFLAVAAAVVAYAAWLWRRSVAVSPEPEIGGAAGEAA